MNLAQQEFEDIFDEYGQQRTRIQASSLQLTPEISCALLNAFRYTFGHTSLETKRQAWRTIRKFALFLRESGKQGCRTLDKEVLVRFFAWLEQSSLAGSTRQSIFNAVSQSLHWCARNTNVIPGRALRMPVRRFSRQIPKRSEVLPVEDIKRILKAAYADIDETLTRLARGRRIALGQGESTPEKELGVLIQELLQHGNGRFPKRSELGSARKGFFRRIEAYGGMREISRALLASPADVFPFYLAILIQTAGNPMAVLAMKRESVRQHSLKPGRCTVVWSKPRSRAEQKAEFSTLKKRAAPNLIKALNSATEPLAAMAGEKKDQLFAAYSSCGIAIPCMQLMHSLLDQFIVRHDLPNFDFKQFRKTSGFLHHTVSGNVLAAKMKLNHRSVRTTLLYTIPEAFAQSNDRLIYTFQGEFAKKARAGSVTPTVAKTRPAAKTRDTVFGFVCKDPFGGSIPESPPGQPCPMFSRCATCPGAVITLDDPNVVARLVKTRLALKETERRATEAGWLHRFDALYRPTLQIIENDLLIRISPRLIEFAASIATPDIPFLE